MNQARLQLKGKLHDLKMERMKFATAAKANINAAKNLLAISTVTPIEEINLQEARVHINESFEQQKTYLQICDDIKAIEEELE